VIVGGGYTGLSTALHLAEAGASVVLLEAQAIAFGASGRNGGQVNPGLRLDPDDLVARFGAERADRIIAVSGGAPDFVFGLAKRLGIECDAVRPGWVLVAHSPATLAKLQRRGEQWVRRGVAMRALDADETAAMVGTRRYIGGLYDPRGGSVQPLSYARGLAQAATRAGARLFTHSPVTRLEKQGSDWIATTPRGSVAAPQVVIATNGYTDDLWPGLRQSILPVRTFQVATRPLGHNLERSILPGNHAVSDLRRLILYFRKDAHGRLIMGGRASSTQRGGARLFGFLTGVVQDMFPQLGRPEFEHAWSGTVALTPDFLPHIHEPAQGVLAALGYNGRGVAMASVAGKALADRVRGGRAEDLPLPVSDIRPIPFHGLRQPVLHLIMQYHRVMDWLGR